MIHGNINHLKLKMEVLDQILIRTFLYHICRFWIKFSSKLEMANKGLAINKSISFNYMVKITIDSYNWKPIPK